MPTKYKRSKQQQHATTTAHYITTAATP